MTPFKIYLINSIFVSAIAILNGCSSAPSAFINSKSSEDATIRFDIINWGSNFTEFWQKAQNAPFSQQISLWEELVEKPHEKFYSSVVWHNIDSPDFLERKTKRLKEIFNGYSEMNIEIQSNFNNFKTTLKSQVVKFKYAFPLATFTLPIMAVPAPTFNGKIDSYNDNGEKHFLAFGIDTATIRHDSQNVLYSHELFHVYHGEVSGVKDDGASENATLTDSLWAEGLATYVSKELNPSVTLKDIFMDEALASEPETKLSYLSAEFLKVKDELVHSKKNPELYGQWFLLNKCTQSLKPCRSGYFLGYHVAQFLRQQYSLDEMAHWPFRTAKEKIVVVLKRWALKNKR